MTKDSKELDSTTSADDNQEVPSTKETGPKASGTLNRKVRPARGGLSPAGSLNAEPDPKPDEKDVPPKATGTLKKDAGPARG